MKCNKATADAAKHDVAPSKLTRRELEVIKLVAQGLTTAEIAGQLGLSVKTVDCQRTSMMRKLDMHRIADVTRYAIRHKLVEA